VPKDGFQDIYCNKGGGTELWWNVVLIANIAFQHPKIIDITIWNIFVWLMGIIFTESTRTETKSSILMLVVRNWNVDMKEMKNV
jgi:hypothetical protein